MKVINVGDDATTFGIYEDMLLKKGTKLNKFGTLYYLKDRIYLVHNQFVADYSLYDGSERSGLQLCLGLDAALKAELERVMEHMKRQVPTLQFKPFDSDKIYIKVSDKCEKIETKCLLQFSIEIYGAFYQNATKQSFLQMNVLEAKTKKLSLLNQTPSSTNTLNYMPNSEAWEREMDLSGI
jgi:hypothetical protein